MAFAVEGAVSVMFMHILDLLRMYTFCVCLSFSVICVQCIRFRAMQPVSKCFQSCFFEQGLFEEEDRERDLGLAKGLPVFDWKVGR